MPRFTITLSDDLAEVAEILRKRHKLYRTLSELVQGLIRYDGQTQREHHLTAEWALMSGYERDRLDAAILRQVKSGEGVRGSWLEARINDIVQAHLAKGDVPTTKQVASELAEQIAKTAQRADEESDGRKHD